MITASLRGRSLRVPSALHRDRECGRTCDSARLPLSDDAYPGTEALEDLLLTYIRVSERDKAMDFIDALLSIPSEVSVAKLKLDPD